MPASPFNTARLATVVKITGSTLTTVDGIDPMLAGRILGRTRSPSRFGNGSPFASYTGTFHRGQQRRMGPSPPLPQR